MSEFNLYEGLENDDVFDSIRCEAYSSEIRIGSMEEVNFQSL